MKLLNSVEISDSREAVGRGLRNQASSKRERRRGLWVQSDRSCDCHWANPGRAGERINIEANAIPTCEATTHKAPVTKTNIFSTQISAAAVLSVSVIERQVGDGTASALEPVGNPSVSEPSS